MIVGVAVCPGVPLSVRGLAPRPALRAPDLVPGCAAPGSDMHWTSGPSFGGLSERWPDLPRTPAELHDSAAPFGGGCLVADWNRG